MLKVWDRVAFGNWRPYEEAKKYAQSLKLKNVFEWKKFNKFNDIPQHLNRVYKKYWKNWGDFLGTGNIANYLKKYRTFNEAKKYAQSLKLKTEEEWIIHTKSKKLPKDIPAYPGQTYKK